MIIKQTFYNLKRQHHLSSKHIFDWNANCMHHSFPIWLPISIVLKNQSQRKVFGLKIKMIMGLFNQTVHSLCFSREVQGEPCVLLELCVWDPNVDCPHPTMTLWWNVQACISTGELWELDTQVPPLPKLLQKGTLKRKDRQSEKTSLHKKSSRVFTPHHGCPWSP